MHFRPLGVGLAAVFALKPGAAPAVKPAVVVTVIATEYAFQAPDTISAGLVQFRLINQGKGLHNLWIMRLDGNHRAVDVLKGFREGQTSPAWAQNLGGPNVPVAGKASIVSLALTPGRYGLFCFIPDPDGVRHLMKGMVKELRVEGPERRSLSPQPTLRVKLVDNAFGLSGPLRAGHQVIAVRNEGAQTHMLVLLRLDPGKHPSDYVRWAASRAGPPPAKTYGGTTGMAPGILNIIEADLVPGDYALMCFAPDANGKPHTAHGMMQEVRVL